jgi:hypothetical protein
MPAFAPNFTARLKVHYHAANANHTQQFRCLVLGGGFATVDALIVDVQAYYDAIAPNMFDDWAILDVSVAAEGALVFVPHGTLTVTGSIPVAGAPARIKAGQLSFPGRSDNGNPHIVYQYGWASPPGDATEGDDFRINPGEDTDIDNAIAALQASTIMVANDGGGCNFKTYANLKYNDNWTKKIRKGS